MTSRPDVPVPGGDAPRTVRARGEQEDARDA